MSATVRCCRVRLREICENIRDFIVVENDGEIVGCGALHLYGMHLAEIRSITVTSKSKGQGRGSGAGRCSAERSPAAERDLRVPVHPHSRVLRTHGLSPGREGSPARQGAEGLRDSARVRTPATRSRCICGTLPKVARLRAGRARSSPTCRSRPARGELQLLGRRRCRALDVGRDFPGRRYPTPRWAWSSPSCRFTWSYRRS